MKDIIFKFTLLFALCSIVIWLPFILTGRTFVWNVDGISQHIPALIFFRRWILEVFGNLFTGHPDIPMWSFSLGEGSDVVNTLHYYCIGDPLALIVILFPEKMMGICFTVLSVLRVYLAGIAFIVFARNKEPRASLAAYLTGGLTYSLSNWALYCAVRHSFFLNPLILLPLMLTGIDRIGRGKKPYMFIIVTAISAVTSVYFFYMIVIISIIYAVIMFPDIKKLLVMLLSGIWGCLIGAVIIIPQAIFLMSDGRSGDKGGAIFFYDLMHYLKIPSDFAAGGTDDYLLMGFGAAGVILLIFLLMNKGHIKLKIFSAVSLLFMIFPLFGSIMNGMGYATNRWSFALTLLISFMIFSLWDPFVEDKGKSFKKLMIIFSVYSLLILALSFVTGGILIAAIQIISGIAILFLAYKGVNFKNLSCSKLIAAVAIINLVINGLIPNTVLGGDRPKDFLTNDLVNMAMESSDSEAVLKISSEDLSYPVRYTGPYLNENTSAVCGNFSTQYYWSQTNGNVARARRMLGIDEYRDYYYTGYDGRSELCYLAGAGYYVVPSEWAEAIKAPIGYGDPVSSGEYLIYKTDKVIPFASFFDKTLSEDAWQKLSATAKQDILMTNAVIKGGADEDIKTDSLTLRSETGIILDSDGTKVLDLDVECPSAGELYVVLEDLYFEGSNGEDRADLSVSGKGVAYYTSAFNWYNGKDDFAVCLGRVEEGLRKPRITLTTPGSYKIGKVTVEFIPEDKILSKADDLILRSSCIDNIDAKGDRVSLTSTNSSDGYILLQIPYSSGWKAKVNGQETEVIPCDIMYSAVKVKAGDNKIVLTYRTPGITVGAVITLVSIAGLILAAVISKLMSSRKENEKVEDDDKKYLIAVASHKAYDMPEDKIYQPVLAGAAISETDLPEGWKADDTGDNISDLNPYYSELTAYYWAVKNADPEAAYIGLVHYRRLFGKKKSGPVKASDLDQYLPDAKVFVPRPREYYIETLGSHYAHTLDISQLESAKKALKKVCPEYLSNWDKILNESSGYMFNMNIMERSLAEDYLDWLMKVLEEVCRIKDPAKEEDAFDKRFPGRISELLFNCWLDRAVETGKISPCSIIELDYYSPEKVNWIVKGTAFLKARFLGRKYHKSF